MCILHSYFLRKYHTSYRKRHSYHTDTHQLFYAFFGVKVDHPAQQWQHGPTIHIITEILLHPYHNPEIIACYDT